MKKIVIFAQNRNYFGAQVVLVPLIQQLRYRYPESKIVIFSRNKITTILNQLPELVDSVIIEHNKLETITKYKKINPDITINLRKNSTFTTLLIALLNRGVKIGYKTFMSSLLFSRTVPDNTHMYRANNYLRLIENTDHSSLAPHIEHQIKSNSICIIPGAGKEYKIWPITNYIELAKRLSITHPDKKIIFITAEKEKDFNPLIIESGFDLLFNATLDELYTHIEAASLVIANDSGPSHIAQMSDTKCIIIYSDERGGAKSLIVEWFDNKPGNVALFGERDKPINSISVSRVLDVADNLLIR